MQQVYVVKSNRASPVGGALVRPPETLNARGEAGDPWLRSASSLQLIDGERWYVAYTQPQKEATALAHLGEQGFRCFLPRRLKNVRHARKVQTVLAPVFTRYIFVVLDLARDRWLSVNGTRGIGRLLMTSGRPVPVPPGVVETLVASSDSTGKIKLAAGVEKGAQVRLVAGPFATSLGIIERLDDAGRVGLLLRIMNREVRVATTHDWLVPLIV